MKRNLKVEALPGYEAEIGRWLWAMEDARHRTLEALEGIGEDAIDWQPPQGDSTIGSILYHIAIIELDWLYAEILEQPEFPPEATRLCPYEVREEGGKLTSIPAESLESHLQRLAAVRALLLNALRGMSMAEFRRARSLPSYDVTAEWVIHHLMQHEAEHRSQIANLRAQAEASLATAP